MSILVGALACLAYGTTQAFGYGQPPYSIVYAVALGLSSGLVMHGVLVIKTRWKLWAALVTVALLVIAFGAVAYAKPLGDVSRCRSRLPRPTKRATSTSTVLTQTGQRHDH